jgi:hypothetical protein
VATAEKFRFSLWRAALSWWAARETSRVKITTTKVTTSATTTRSVCRRR